MFESYVVENAVRLHVAHLIIEEFYEDSSCLGPAVFDSILLFQISAFPIYGATLFCQVFVDVDWFRVIRGHEFA